jgi:hypothetical protein
MMELVERLRLGGPNALEVTDEAAAAIADLCERLETCWGGYEAAIKAEREACAKIAKKHRDIAVKPDGKWSDMSVVADDILCEIRNRSSQ